MRGLGIENVDIKYVSEPVPEGSKVVLRSPVGSTVHGTSVFDQDDRDEMALVIEPPEYIVGHANWETTLMRTQLERDRSGPGDLDLVVHSMRKYVRLAMAGNPTILLLLYSPPIDSAWQGRELLACREWFLSKRAGTAFLGYMDAQRKRLAGEQGGRHGAMRVELVEKYGFDTKYAGHIVRLGLQGIELLTTGRLTLPMEEVDRKLVVDVRTGKVTLPQVLTLASGLQAQLENAIKNSALPDECDQTRVNKWLASLYIESWVHVVRYGKLR